MILLNSIWLFALAALSIPVAIHLWNIRPGKTLKVGSIALINASSQTSRSFKLHDILLLLLRCLLLALLAFVLMMPLWQKHIDPASIKGWMLMPKESIRESYQKFKPEIDSLTKAGYEFHYFNKNFQKADLGKILADTGGKKGIGNAVSYWSLIQQLDGRVPSSLPIYLFTPNMATHFYGDKPQVNLNLYWKTYTPADSTTWIQKAWLTNNNDIQVAQGNSKPSGTYFTNYTIQSGSNRNTNFVVNAENGQMTVSLRNSNTVTVDTSIWRFAIYAEKNTSDANYVKAALGSIVQFTKHKAVIKQYVDAGQIPPHQNWIFWLSPKQASKQLISNCDNLFTYETGKIKDAGSWISGQNESLSGQKIALYKSVFLTGNSGQTIWRDGFGNPVLSSEKQQQTNIYHFYSRFDPSWSDLVWSDDFPKMLLKLIIGPDEKTEAIHDLRIIDTKQILPAGNKETRTSTGVITEHIDLSPYLWLLLVLTFIAERWLAHKKASQTAGKQILQNG
jgi:hypothetical protein